MKCSRDYLGDSLPALVTNLKEAHPSVREYMLTMVRERIGSAETAILHAAEKFYSDKRTNGVRSKPTVEFQELWYYRLAGDGSVNYTVGLDRPGTRALPPFTTPEEGYIDGAAYCDRL